MTYFLQAGLVVLLSSVILSFSVAQGVFAEEAASDESKSPANRNVFVSHAYPEKQVDLGEIVMNYAESGSPDKPALLLIPQQGGSWWTYEGAMKLLERDYHVFAVDLRGQGRSTWTPGRYSLDNFGNDLVRFIALVVKEPVIVAGNSSGGVLAAWLSAYAMPGQIKAAMLEDPPLFASELIPAYGHSVRQAIGPLFKLRSTFLGDQWQVGDWEGLAKAMAQSPNPLVNRRPLADTPPQQTKEYDPEWGRVFWDGTVGINSPHDVMLRQLKSPVLLTHHFRLVDPKSGTLVGALSDFQAQKAQDLVRASGTKIDYKSLPDAGHVLHESDPRLYTQVLTDWIATLP